MLKLRIQSMYNLAYTEDSVKRNEAKISELRRETKKRKKHGTEENDSNNIVDVEDDRPSQRTSIHGGKKMKYILKIG